MAKETYTKTVETLETRAAFVPASINKEKRTIDVIFATETPCRMFSWEDGMVEETLSCDPAHVRMERINGGAPVLNNHDRSEGTDSVLGVVDTANMDGTKGTATLRFSTREDVAGTWQDIQDGILRGVSVGYRVYKYEITKEEGKTPQYRAVDWEPFEISMAPVQADINSKVRKEPEIIFTQNKNQNAMTELEKRALAVNLPQNSTKEDVERAEAEKARKEKEASDKVASEAASKATVAERARVNEIGDIVRKGNLDAKRSIEITKELVDGGKTADEARSLVLDEVAKANEVNIRNQNTNLTVGTEQKEKVRDAMVDAIDHRANPNEKLTEAGRDFAGMSLLRMATFCLDQAGVKTRGLSEREIAIAALGLDGQRHYMSSTDFPNIMGSNVNRTLRRAYTFYEPTFTQWASRGTFKDFRAKNVIQLGDVTKMSKIQEGGEYKYGNLSDAAETYKPDKYGLIIPITWESLINDDLNAFSRIPTSIANKARLLQSDLVYTILSANAALGDGVALFHATHANLAGAGAAIDIAPLQAGRKAIRTQKDLNKKDVLNLTPTFLIVGPNSELAAYQFTSTNYVPIANGTINPTYNASLKVVVDPRISGNEWYLACSPAQIDTVEYSFLEGEEMFTDQRIGWEVDGMEIKARMVFAAKAIDYRGLYKNPGA